MLTVSSPDDLSEFIHLIKHTHTHTHSLSLSLTLSRTLTPFPCRPLSWHLRASRRERSGLHHRRGAARRHQGGWAVSCELFVPNFVDFLLFFDIIVCLFVCVGFYFVRSRRHQGGRAVSHKHHLCFLLFFFVVVCLLSSFCVWEVRSPQSSRRLSRKSWTFCN